MFSENIISPHVGMAYLFICVLFFFFLSANIRFYIICVFSHKVWLLFRLLSHSSSLYSIYLQDVVSLLKSPSQNIEVCGSSQHKLL